MNKETVSLQKLCSQKNWSTVPCFREQEAAFDAFVWVSKEMNEFVKFIECQSSARWHSYGKSTDSVNEHFSLQKSD